MLMNEIANAADTLELWKMVNDNVWAALLRLQKEEQARKAAEKIAATKRAPQKRGQRVQRAAQSKPIQQAPQPTLPPTAASQPTPPKPQQMARASAVSPIAPQGSQQAQIGLSQKQA